MTNAQIAHHMGIPKAPAPDWAYRDALIQAGLTVTQQHDFSHVGGTDAYEAELETNRGKLHIMCGVNGTARIDKPNGTHKWVYEKTPAQILALLNQVIACNK